MMTWEVLLGILGMMAIALALCGWLYALFIRWHPLDRTWLEVVFGVGGTVIFITGAQVFIYIYYELVLELAWTLALPSVAFFISGVPQIILQELKLREERKNAKKLQGEYS